jgi:transposase
MKPFAMEFRLAVAEAYRQCESSLEVAEDFPCSESWVRGLMQRERQTGSLAPKPPRLPDNNKLDESDLALIARLVAEKPDILLGELAAALHHKVSVPTVCRACKKLDLSRKKSRRTPPNRTART